MNKICSIFLDQSSLINPSILNFLIKQYDSVILTGNQMTTKHHVELPYIYYNYLRYNYDVDIIFQNLTDIAKFDNSRHKIGYIYNCESHNIDYNTLPMYFKKISFIITDNKKVSKEMLMDVFGYDQEVIYV